jgi:hypothetical protein
MTRPLTLRLNSAFAYAEGLMTIRLAGLFYVLNGLSMLIVWPVLITTDGVPELKTQFIYVVFHLAAEFATAILGITTGVGLLLRKEWSKPLYFLSSGFFLVAGYLACVYYLFTPGTRSVGMASMLFGINLIIIVLLIPNFRRFYPFPKAMADKTILLFEGALLYVLTNVAGMLFDKGTGYDVGYGGAVLLFLGYSLWKSRRIVKQMVCEY